ncbi:MAG: DegQ family serine endoprotease [candidate division WOR-3 bacterium]|nr:DegQ family serine endoprotease [candidate division WOR-3 bacterium]
MIDRPNETKSQQPKLTFAVRTGVIIAVAVIAAFIIGLFLAGTLDFGQRNNVQAQNPISGAESKMPLITPEGTSPFVQVAEAVIPAVVNISAEKTVKIRTPDFQWPFEDFFKDFFKDFGMPESKPREYKTQTLGSGVIINSEGYILTNNHVVAGFDNIIVKLADKTEFKGKKVKIIGRDPKTDIAVLKIEGNGKLPYAKLGNSDNIRVGDWAIAIGNPFGLDGTVTVGVISAKGRSNIPLPEGPTYQDFIQTDASINPGNSGGPLVNIKGEVIGINTAIRSPVGANVGIGFATPINLAKEIADQLIAKGKIVRGYLGVRPQEITQEIKEAMGLKSTEGVLIGEVVEKTAADKAGLKEGDVIVKFDGKKVTNVEQFRRMVAETKPGKEVEIEVIRDGKSITLTAKLQEMPDEISGTPQETPEAEETEVKSWLGMKVRMPTETEKENAKVKSGVVVDEVEGGSIADQAGIREGDIILKIDRYEIANTKDFSQAVRKLRDSKKPILFRLKRGTVSVFIAVTPE